MATTLATFYATYKDLALSGVTNLDESPLSVATVKLPCKFIDSASIEEGPLRAKGTGGQRVLRCRVVVLVAAAGQDLHSSRWSDTVAMADTLNAGIKTVGKRSKTWTVNAMPNFNEGAWFAAVATIEEPEGVV